MGGFFIGSPPSASADKRDSSSFVVLAVSPATQASLLTQSPGFQKPQAVELFEIPFSPA